jgi:predicted GIY-YIG superfamily endonuclease
MTTIYLLHFSAPIAPGRHTCQHYLGSAEDLAVRLAQHRAGSGARLCAVALERGIDFKLARTWSGDRKLEKQLKRRHASNRLCPVCNGQAQQLDLFLEFTLDDVEELAF